VWLVFALGDFATERQLVTPLLHELSLFAHVPNVLLGEPVVALPLAGLLVLAALLVTVGVFGFTRRDIG
jgi:putative exporter of polyketide antibiotics